MSITSLFYFNESHGKTQARTLELIYKITAAKTVSPAVFGYPALVTFDALSTQSQIDDRLGTTNEFLLAAFDSTAMGQDAFGGVIAMSGQVGTLVGLEAKVNYGTEGATVGERIANPTTTLTASTLATECAVGANGNLGFRVKFNVGSAGDFDALTSGRITIKLKWISK